MKKGLQKDQRKQDTEKVSGVYRGQAEAYEEMADSASAQECTGLIPAALTSEAELEAYEELYSFLPSKKTGKK